MSDTMMYILVTVVLLHFVVGFVWLVKKMSGPVENKDEDQA